MWPFRKIEKRSGAGSGSYTDAIVSAILSTTGGKTLSIPASTAAVEMATGVVCRAFQAAEVSGTTETVKTSLTSDFRGVTARTILRTGEALFLIRVSGGVIHLIPVDSSTVTGGPDPRTWTYELTCGGPGGSQTYKDVSPASVLHFRYAFDPGRAWQGVGPLQSATLAGRLAGNLAGALADEAGTARGYVLPIPRVNGLDESVDELRSDLGNADGGLYTVESMASMDFGTARTAGGEGWNVKRLGVNVPANIIQLQELATKEVLSMFGISPALFAGADGTAAREAWRQALHGVIMPLARTIETELRAKLESPDLTLSFDRLFASDISGRARAFQSLVGGGMDVAKAANLSGLLNTEE